MHSAEGFAVQAVDITTWVIPLLTRDRFPGALMTGKLTKTIACVKALVIVAAILCTALFSTFAFAARPLTTDDAGTVEKGKFQVETGFDFARQDNHDKEFTPSATLTYGLFERMDLGVGAAWLFFNPAEGERQQGFADTVLKVKYRFLDDQSWMPAFAVSGTVKIPTASESKGLGSGKPDFSINGILTKNLSKRWAVYLNGGYTFIGEHGVNNEWSYALAGQFALSDKWALVGEIAGANNFNGRKNDDPLSALLGIQHTFNENLVWDAGAGIGMNRAAPDFRLATGLTLFFKP
jgi:hypothetical protein